MTPANGNGYDPLRARKAPFNIMYKTNLKTITDVVSYKDIKAVVAAAKMTKDDELASIGIITYGASDLRDVIEEADGYRYNMIKLCYGLYDVVDSMLYSNHLLPETVVFAYDKDGRELSIPVTRKLSTGDTNYTCKNGSGNWAFKIMLDYAITSVKHVMFVSNYEILDAGDKGYGCTINNTTKIILDGCAAIHEAIDILSDGNPVRRYRDVEACDANDVKRSLYRLFKDSFTTCGHGRNYLECAPAYTFQYNDGSDWAENPFVVYPYKASNQDEVIPMFSVKWRKRATLINMKAELEGILVGQNVELYPTIEGYFNTLSYYLNLWLKKVTSFTWRRDKNINRHDPKYTLMRYFITAANSIKDELSQLALMERKNSKLFDSLESDIRVTLADDIAKIIVATLTLPFCRILGRVGEAPAAGELPVAFRMEEFQCGDSQDLDDLVGLINHILKIKY